MIFPEDYKLVGIKDGERRGDPVYFSTRYLISREGPRLYAVTSRGEGFLREAAQLQLIASGDQILFYGERVDTRNRTRLIDLATEVCRRSMPGGVNTVVFQGPDEHITFVKDPDQSQVLAIDVLDVSPPNPPWLLHVLTRLEDCGLLGDLMVRFVPRVLDIRGYEGEDVYYPCRAAGLGRSLDCDAVVHEHPRIVGCEVSREIFLAGHAAAGYDFVNVCPLSSSHAAFLPERPFLTRCCRSERRGRVEKNGQTGMAVHWGDGPWEIAQAVRQLVQLVRPGRDGEVAE
ncbi:MAG TPA: hypothetical protein PKK11_05930 [Methanothrix sp.]|nr:hypothetical protein [Methanothrix sp.]HPT18933.1 hypothetical protein [Methanothrix sp.]